MPSRPLYIVLAQAESGGHGPWPVLLQTTWGARKALATARQAENLGYDLDSDTGISIYRVAPGQVLVRKTIETSLAYTRRWPDSSDRHRTNEYFWCPQLAAQFGMTHVTSFEEGSNRIKKTR